MRKSKTVFVKFRASETQKNILSEAASRRGITASALLRRFVVTLRPGAQPTSDAARSEWAAVRQLANQVLTFADETDRLPLDVAERLRVTGASLHRMARIHLSPVE